MRDTGSSKSVLGESICSEILFYLRCGRDIGPTCEERETWPEDCAARRGGDFPERAEHGCRLESST